MKESWTVEIIGPEVDGLSVVYAHATTQLLVDSTYVRPAVTTLSKEYADLLTVLDLVRASILADANAERFS